MNSLQDDKSKRSSGHSSKSDLKSESKSKNKSKSKSKSKSKKSSGHSSKSDLCLFFKLRPFGTFRKVDISPNLSSQSSGNLNNLHLFPSTFNLQNMYFKRLNQKFETAFFVFIPNLSGKRSGLGLVAIVSKPPSPQLTRGFTIDIQILIVYYISMILRSCGNCLKSPLAIFNQKIYY